MYLVPILSESERQYILEGVRQGTREDGRSCNRVRYFSVKTGVVSNTSGSSKIDREKTSAIIGVKAELGKPHPYSPNLGRLEFHVDCSSLVHPDYQHNDGVIMGGHLANGLEEAYLSESAVNREALCVVPGQQCWVLYVDVLVLEVGGSVLDTLSLGVRAALQSTVIPLLTVTGEGEEMEITVSDNPHDSLPVQAEGAPIIITLNQIGDSFVVDCSIEEELCNSWQLSLAVDCHGNILSTNMEGKGGIPYHKLSDIIEMGLEVANNVLSSLDADKKSISENSSIFFENAR